MFADHLHELERRARRELETFKLIKPECLAGHAHIDDDARTEVGV
jgi:hypothetical protein